MQHKCKRKSLNHSYIQIKMEESGGHGGNFKKY